MRDATQPQQTFTVTIDLSEPLLWEPETPNLYTVDLKLIAPNQSPDVLHTYFGMRSIEVRGENALLNGHPVYLRSALVQGYWADRLGLLLWNDVPCPVDFTALARERLIREIQVMIERDYNHPSIVIWSPYNESWGLQFRSQIDIQIYLIALYNQIKVWDSTRLVVDNSGWRHVRTDVADSHKYTANTWEWSDYLSLLETAPMDVSVLGHPFFAEGQFYSGQPLMVSGYGTGWGEERPADFQWQTAEIRRHGGLVGYIYTELYDVEHELAGLARYDRTLKPIAYDMATVNTSDFVGLDYQGKLFVKGGQVIDAPIFISAYGQPALSTTTVDWRLERITGEPETLLTGSYGTLTLTPYSVTTLVPLSFTLPETKGSVRLTVEVREPDGTLRASNTLNLASF